MPPATRPLRCGRCVLTPPSLDAAQKQPTRTEKRREQGIDNPTPFRNAAIRTRRTREGWVPIATGTRRYRRCGRGRQSGLPSQERLVDGRGKVAGRPAVERLTQGLQRNGGNERASSSFTVEAEDDGPLVAGLVADVGDVGRIVADLHTGGRAWRVRPSGTSSADATSTGKAYTCSESLRPGAPCPAR
jgi:hypothetical protein